MIYIKLSPMQAAAGEDISDEELLARIGYEYTDKELNAEEVRAMVESGVYMVIHCSESELASLSNLFYELAARGRQIPPCLTLWAANCLKFVQDDSTSTGSAFRRRIADMATRSSFTRGRPKLEDEQVKIAAIVGATMKEFGMSANKCITMLAESMGRDASTIRKIYYKFRIHKDFEKHIKTLEVLGKK